MKKSTKWVGIGAAFAFAAGLWALYPENREMVVHSVHTVATKVGLGKPAIQKEQIPNFIEAGFPLPPQPAPQTGQQPAKAASPYTPDTAAQACSVDGKVAVIAYGIAFIEDQQRDTHLALPGIRQDQEKYKAFQRTVVSTAIQTRWQKDVPAAVLAGLDMRNKQQRESLQAWLQQRAQDILAQDGLKVAFKVNTSSGVTVTPARTDAIDACTPPGKMPAPLSSGGQGPNPQPF